MQIIDQYSRAIIEFSLIWKEGEIQHQDSFWADPVSFWRDILEPELVRGLIGQQVGGRATVDIVADRFFQPLSSKKNGCWSVPGSSEMWAPMATVSP